MLVWNTISLRYKKYDEEDAGSTLWFWHACTDFKYKCTKEDINRFSALIPNSKGICCL